MFRSLKAQLGGVFLSFLLLVGGSVAATFVALRAQASDALVINLAGRQRMLIQQMAKDALEAEKNDDHAPALREAANTFDATLWALIGGGQAPFQPGQTVEVPATDDPEILLGLQQVHRAWDAFRASLNVVMISEPGSPEFVSALQSVERLAPELAQKTDAVVGLYEAASARKVSRLQSIQIIFFVSALALLATGALVTQRLIIGPLHNLSGAAARIGHGDLNTPVEMQGSGEVFALSHSLDTMRTQLQTSQEALKAWAGELETRVNQRTRELVALYEISREITSRLDITHVLRSVTDKARELMGGDVAALCLLDGAGQVLNLQSVSGPKETVARTSASAQDLPAERVLAADRAVICGSGNCAGACSVLADSFRTSHMAAPLRVGDRAIGALCVGSQRAGAFSAEAVNLLTKLADSVAIALENARLYEQAERVAMLEERQRIASEMHDGVAQTLSYVDLRAAEAVELAEAGRSEATADVLRCVREAIAQASREARQAIVTLQENPPRRYALQDQLTGLLNEPAANGGPPIELAITLPPPPLFLPSAENEQVIRVAREALLNAWRHAEASHIAVRLEQSATEAAVVVEDDGRGFDPGAQVLDGGHHFGLSIMRARAARLGGRLTVSSTLGQGTRVVLSWPLSPIDDEEPLAKIEG